MASILEMAHRKKLGPSNSRSHFYVVSRRASLSRPKTLNCLQAGGLMEQLLVHHGKVKQNGHAAHWRRGCA